MTAIAKIHVLKKQLGLDDDTYRAMLNVQTGMTSAKHLNKAQCLKVIGYMTACLNNQHSLAGKTAPELRTHLQRLLRNQGKHKNYAQEIATRMHKKGLWQCTAEELLQVIDAVDKVGYD